MTRRIAVVLFNLGGPDQLSSVKPFLFNLFNDPAIIGFGQPVRWILAKLLSELRAKTATGIYREMGGRSPLLEETQAQSDALSASLDLVLPGDTVKVVIAMRYWRPFSSEAAAALRAFKPDHIVLLPLYPQYSTTTTGSSVSAWNAAYKGGGSQHLVCCYPDLDSLVEAHALRLREATGDLQGLRLLFSAHGLPEKIIAGGDPYQSQVERSARAVAARVGAADWQVCYQSRVGPMKWIGPSTVEAIQQAGRDKVGVVVIPIAFVSEHSETLVELDIEYAEVARQAGVPVYRRARAIGVEPNFIAGLTQIVLAALEAGPVTAQASPCALGFAKCPRQREGYAA